MKLPEMVRVRQRFDAPREADIPQAVQRELARLDLAKRIKPGHSVALTAGSRGIANIGAILKAAVDYLRTLQAEPFIIPAMGSHGGGTAEGQREVIESYGITEAAVGAPIRASMEVVEIGKNDFGTPVYLDREASRANHIGVIGRVKPHTGFIGAIESGLCKMMLIGLGKHVGAKAYHQALVRHPWEPFARSTANVMLAQAPIRFGLAIVENAYDETGKIEAVGPEELIAVEEELLKLARTWMPRLPFSDADLLIIDQMGKEISGAGIDTNVVGRKGVMDKLVSGQNPIRRIFVRDLSAKTHGNASGIGFADFTTDRLVKAMDYQVTIINCLTASHPEGAMIPVHLPNDREGIVAALKTTGLGDLAEAKIQRIRDTLHLGELLVSRNYDLSAAQSELEVVGPADFAFDGDGNLTDRL